MKCLNIALITLTLVTVMCEANFNFLFPDQYKYMLLNINPSLKRFFNVMSPFNIFNRIDQIPITDNPSTDVSDTTESKITQLKLSEKWKSFVSMMYDKSTNYHSVF